MILKPPADRPVHELKTATVWFGDDGILHGISRKGIKRTEENIRKTLEAYREISSDEKVYAILDVTHSGENTREARQYAAREFPKLFKALAIVSGSALGRMVANLFVTIKTQPYPVKFFNSEEEAREWLKQLKV